MLLKNREKLVKFYTKYMTIIGVLGQFMFFFQAYKIFAAKNAGSVSFSGFTISLIAVSSWLVYGVLIKNRVLIVSNIVAVIGAMLVLIGIVTYS